MKFNRELFEYAYAVIDGVPDVHIYMDVVRKYTSSWSAVPITHCGAIGCAMGLLAMHPSFNAAGLSYSDSYVSLMFKGKPCDFVDAARLLFGMNNQSGKNVFTSRGCSKYDSTGTSYITDKALFQRRAKLFLAEVDGKRVLA